MIHTLTSKQFLRIDIHTAWDFFSSAANLSKITPADMDFRIQTDLGDEEVTEGMIIDYTVTPLFGVPLRWQTEICSVQKPWLFIDRQLKGPYTMWEHTHQFKEVDGGVLMHDLVRYQLPLGFIGNIVHTLIVKEKIRKIFKFREETLNKIFESDGST